MEKPTRICKIDGCGRDGHLRRGWCNAHYRRWLTHGDPLAGPPMRMFAPEDGLCTIEGCEKPYYGRGLCAMHNARQKRNGDPLTTQRFFDPSEALKARTRRDGECLTWTGTTNEKGYGSLRANGPMVLAHRFAWELSNGPIPDGLVVDHICHNRACVNVDHLRLATLQQNGIHRAGASHHSSTGVRNVFPHRDRFQVQIHVDGTQRYFGTYESLTEASAVAEEIRQRLFGEYAGRG